MDDIDSFLASLDRFNAPSISASISALSSQRQQPSQAAAVQSVSESEVNQRATARRPERKRHRHAKKESTGDASQIVGAASVPSTTLPSLQTAQVSPCASPQPAEGEMGDIPRRRTRRDHHEDERQQQQQRPPRRATDTSHAAETWSCSLCTLLNPNEAAQCGACGQPKSATVAQTPSLSSAVVGDPRASPGSGQAPAPAACTRCTFLNEPTAVRCGMCEAPLPKSRQRPSASPPPTTGPAMRGRADGGLVEGEHTAEGHGKWDGEGEETDEDDSSGDSGDSDSSGSSDDGDSGTDDEEERRSGSGKDPLDNRELVNFLQTLEAVPYDQLPPAPAPPTMRIRGQLKPFQLQALHWMQAQEAGTSALEANGTGMDRRGSAVAVDVDDGERESHSDGALLFGSGSSSDHARGMGVQPAKPAAGVGFPAGGGRRGSKESLQTVRGGIFADYMGLGKTRTMVALCESTSAVRLQQLRQASRVAAGGEGQRASPSQQRHGGGAARVERVTGSQVVTEATLVVCPTALLRQWANEISCCIDAAPSGKGGKGPHHASCGLAPAPRILLYHGARRKRLSMFEIAEQYDYVLTSYQTLRHEHMPRFTNGDASALENGEGDANGDWRRGLAAARPRTDSFFSVEETMREAAPGKLFMIEWKRVILDEAHTIRNMRAKMTRACMKLTARYRWAVTATPVQNSLNDLYPLLKFLGVPHFGTLQWWNEEIVHYFNEDPNHPRPVTALRVLFSALLLRRTPDSVVRGEKILDLPPKAIRTEYIALSRKEQAFYNAVHASAARKIDLAVQRSREAAAAASAPSRTTDDRWASDGTFHPAQQLTLTAPPPPPAPVNRLTTFSTAFEMLMRCRQTCLHPYIVVAALRRCRDRRRGDGSVVAPAAAAAAASEAERQVGAADSREDGIGAGATASPSASSSLVANGRDGLAAAQRQQQQQRLREEAEEQRRLTAALNAFVDGALRRAIAVQRGTAFVQELVEELRKQRLEDRECSICLDRLLRPAILPCGHTFCEDCITHAMQVKRQCPMCKRGVHPSRILLVPEELLRKEKPSAAQAGAGAGPDSASPSPTAHEEEGAKAVDVAAEVANVDVTNLQNWPLELSAKTRYLLDALRAIPADEKIIVFSSFTTYLDYAKHCLDAVGIPSVLYTGALSLKQKDSVVRQFSGDGAVAAAGEADRAGGHVADPVSSRGLSTTSTSAAATCTAVTTTAVAAASPPTLSDSPRTPRVLLASTTACGVGLNLVCANHCFLMDPVWNPGAEDQALNRIHRIGQTKPVTVVKLIARGTVEEKMEMLNQRKRQLSGYCFTGGTAGGRLRAEELMALFVDDSDESDESDSDDEAHS